MNLKKLIPLYIGAAIGPMGGIGIFPLIPGLAREWSVEFTIASLAITFYMTPFIIIQLFSGAIAQLFDVRKTLFFGFATYALGGLLCGLSPNLWALLGSRVVQGVGAAFLTPIIMALIGELVPEQHIGKAIGMLGLAYTVGVTLGPLISGLIEVSYGWPGFFYFLGVLSLTAGVFYAVSSESSQRGMGEQKGILAVVPILKQALIQPGVLYLSFSAFAFFIAYIGIMAFTADHLKSNHNLLSNQIGAVLSVTGFSGIIVSPIAGFLGDRLGRHRVFLAGAFIVLLSMALMALVSYSYSLYLILFLMLGIGSATAWTSLNTMAVQISPSMRKPVTSVYNAVKFAGYALSPVILSFLYTPFKLKAVQFGCMGAVVISAALAVSSVYSRKRV
ncbi:MAG: MFS transporter [Pseudomonadota bacterium]